MYNEDVLARVDAAAGRCRGGGGGAGSARLRELCESSKRPQTSLSCDIFSCNSPVCVVPCIGSIRAAAGPAARQQSCADVADRPSLVLDRRTSRGGIHAGAPRSARELLNRVVRTRQHSSVALWHHCSAALHLLCPPARAVIHAQLHGLTQCCPHQLLLSMTWTTGNTEEHFCMLNKYSPE